MATVLERNKERERERERKKEKEKGRKEGMKGRRGREGGRKEEKENSRAACAQKQVVHILAVILLMAPGQNDRFCISKR